MVHRGKMHGFMRMYWAKKARPPLMLTRSASCLFVEKKKKKEKKVMPYSRQRQPQRKSCKTSVTAPPPKARAR